MNTRTTGRTVQSIGHRQAIRTIGAAGAGLAVGRSGLRASTDNEASQTENGAQRAHDVRSSEVLRHGAYLCFHFPKEERRRRSVAGVHALADQLGFTNEFENSAGHPTQAIAFLKRGHSASAQIDDQALLTADAIVHVAAPDARPVDAFCAELPRLLGLSTAPRILRGVVRPTVYTGNAMHEFAYADQAVQQSGAAMPNAFLIPMNKTPEWWAKDWMERNTYFLPRYDTHGQMVHEGHALAAAAGIPCIMRRAYKSQSQPAAVDTYEFLNYFECADTDVSTLEAVVAALRDVKRNPEWTFVREGPTWRGRRVPEWSDLFA